MYDSANLKKVKTLKELAPEGMAAWATLNDVAMKDGAIPRKYKELMALAVAFTTQCPYCIEIHAKAARTVGCTDAEIAEAAVVAAALRAGGRDHARHARHLMTGPLSSAAEHSPYTGGVTGSNPVVPHLRGSNLGFTAKISLLLPRLRRLSGRVYCAKVARNPSDPENRHAAPPKDHPDLHPATVKPIAPASSGRIG